MISTSKSKQWFNGQFSLSLSYQFFFIYSDQQYIFVFLFFMLVKNIEDVCWRQRNSVEIEISQICFFLLLSDESSYKATWFPWLIRIKISHCRYVRKAAAAEENEIGSVCRNGLTVSSTHKAYNISFIQFSILLLP